MEYARYSENKGHLFIFEYVFLVSDHDTHIVYAGKLKRKKKKKENYPQVLITIFGQLCLRNDRMLVAKTENQVWAGAAAH